MIEVMLEIECWYEKSSLKDVWFSFEATGLKINYKAYTRTLDYDPWELLEILKTTNCDIDDKQFLVLLGITDYDFSYTFLAILRNRLESEACSTLFSEFESYFERVGIQFVGGRKYIRLIFGSKQIKLKYSDFKDVIRFHLGHYLNSGSLDEAYQKMNSRYGDAYLR